DVALLRLLSISLAPWLEPASSPVAAVEAALPDGTAAGAADVDPIGELARVVCDAMTREVEPPRVLGSALPGRAGSRRAEPVALFLLDPESDALRQESQWAAGGSADRASVTRNGGLVGLAFETGQPVVCHDPASDPRFDAAADTPESGAVAPFVV